MFDKIKNAVSNASSGELGNMSDINTYLEGLNFPAGKDEIITHLRENGANEEVLMKVQQLGEDHFNSQADLLTKFISERK